MLHDTLQSPTTPAFKQRLKHKVVRPFGVIMAIAFTSLSLSLAGQLWNRKNFYQLIDFRIPLTVTSLELKSTIHKVLATSRDWINFKQTSALLLRKKLWDQTLHGLLDELEDLTEQAGDAGTYRKLVHLMPYLNKLQDWFWHIEEVTIATGNDPVLQFYLDMPEDVIQDIDGFSKTLMVMISNEGLQEGNAQQFETISKFRGEFNKLIAQLMRYIQSKDLDDKEQFWAQFDRVEPVYETILTMRYASSATTEFKYFVHMLKVNWEAFTELSREVVLKRQMFTSTLDRKWLIEEAIPLENVIEESLVGISESQDTMMHDLVKKAEKINELMPLCYGGMLFIMLLVGARLSRRITFQVLQPIERLVVATEALSEDKLDEDIPVQSSDEVGKLTYAFNQMRQKLVAGKEILLANQEKLARHAENLERAAWAKNSQIQLADAMRGVQDVKELCHNMMKMLCQILNAAVGCLYLADEAEGHYNLVATFGCKDVSQIPERVGIHDGWVGEVIKSKLKQTLSDIPSNYLNVYTTLGESPVTQIHVIPITHADKIIGVLEIGTWEAYAEDKHEFIDNAIENIGVGLYSSQSRDQLRSLLETTHQQSEELRSQQEELRVTNEELQSQSKALLARTEEIEKQNATLEKSRKELEEKSNALAQSNKYKSEFLATMSHELRTPLNSILILSKNLMLNKKENLESKQVEHLKVIHSSGSDLLELINDILDLSKGEAGKLEIHMEPVLLADVCDNLRQMFSPVAEEHNIGFDIEICDNVPERIQADQVRLEQILRNLLSNAMKFTEKGSIKFIIKPSHDTDLLQNTSLDASNSVQFSVVDSGCGISHDKQESIFKAFQQEDGSISRKYGGTGLGLTISRQLAQLMGGEAHLVRSEPNVGSEFCLFLPHGDPDMPAPKATQAVAAAYPAPATDEDAEPTPPVTHLSPVASNCVLIVDDDARFAATLAGLVRDFGFEARFVETGQQAIDLAKQINLMAIVLDIGLPDMSGWDVLETLRRDKKTHQVPVHILSGHDVRNEAIQRGAISFLTKPVSQEKFSELFKRAEQATGDHFRSVLVVDDDAIQVEEITKILSGTADSIVRAESYQQAASMLAEQQFDCIILDINLPDKSGPELLKAIDGLNPTHTTPIFVYTAQSLTPDQEKELGEYSHRIILKTPVSNHRLADEVSLFLNKIQGERQEEMVKQDLGENLDKTIANQHVLIVDDDMRNIYSLSAVLQEQACDIHSACNGQECLEYLAGAPSVDIVLMDIMMPVMDGYTTIQEIRKLDRYKKTPIIALTAKAMQGDRKKCIDAGANDYITKPVNMDQLINLMNIWVNREQG